MMLIGRRAYNIRPDVPRVNLASRTITLARASSSPCVAVSHRLFQWGLLVVNVVPFADES